MTTLGKTMIWSIVLVATTGRCQQNCTEQPPAGRWVVMQGPTEVLRTNTAIAHGLLRSFGEGAASPRLTVRTYVRWVLPPDHWYWMANMQEMTKTNGSCWDLKVDFGPRWLRAKKVQLEVFPVLMTMDVLGDPNLPGAASPYYKEFSNDEEFIKAILPFVYRHDRRAIGEPFFVVRERTFLESIVSLWPWGAGK